MHDKLRFQKGTRLFEHPSFEQKADKATIKTLFGILLQMLQIRGNCNIWGSQNAWTVITKALSVQIQFTFSKQGDARLIWVLPLGRFRESCPTFLILMWGSHEFDHFRQRSSTNYTGLLIILLTRHLILNVVNVNHICKCLYGLLVSLLVNIFKL